MPQRRSTIDLQGDVALKKVGEWRKQGTSDPRRIQRLVKMAVPIAIMATMFQFPAARNWVTWPMMWFEKR